MTVMQHKPINPIAHLTAEDIEELGRELDAIRDEVIASRGETRRGLHPQGHRRRSASSSWAAGPCCCSRSSRRPGCVGTAGLSVAKILENMEIGHNVMHGQWDWMRDPKIHSTTWEWDNASPADSGSTRTTSCTTPTPTSSARTTTSATASCGSTRTRRWHPFYLAQPLWNFLNACFFQYGIAAYDLELGKNLAQAAGTRTGVPRAGKRVLPQDPQAGDARTTCSTRCCRARRSCTTLAANVTANLVRNLWTHSVIMCGHFPEGVQTFEKTSIEGETRGEWYLRQMLGSANISGSRPCTS